MSFLYNSNPNHGQQQEQQQHGQEEINSSNTLKRPRSLLGTLSQVSNAQQEQHNNNHHQAQSSSPSHSSSSPEYEPCAHSFKRLKLDYSSSATSSATPSPSYNPHQHQQHQQQMWYQHLQQQQNFYTNSNTNNDHQYPRTNPIATAPKQQLPGQDTSGDEQPRRKGMNTSAYTHAAVSSETSLSSAAEPQPQVVSYGTMNHLLGGLHEERRRHQQQRRLQQQQQQQRHKKQYQLPSNSQLY